MKKVLVCIEDSLLSIRISRVLTSQGIAYDIVNSPIKKDDLVRYELLIIHSSYKLTGLYAFIESVVLNNIIPVIFISMNSLSTTFHQLSKHPSFIHVDEVKMDTILPVTISLFIKQKLRVLELEKERNSLSKKLETEQALSKCKKYLSDLGFCEEEAHQYILKFAMDHKISKYLACIKILEEKK